MPKISMSSARSVVKFLRPTCDQHSFFEKMAFNVPFNPNLLIFMRWIWLNELRWRPGFANRFVCILVTCCLYTATLTERHEISELRR